MYWVNTKVGHLKPISAKLPLGTALVKSKSFPMSVAYSPNKTTWTNFVISKPPFVTTASVVLTLQIIEAAVGTLLAIVVLATSQILVLYCRF